MEIEIKVKATPKEMLSYFEFDEVLDIRYYEKIDQDVYRVRIRIPECEGFRKDRVCNLDFLKKKIVKFCPNEYGVVGEAVFEKRRKFYAPNNYWLEEVVKNYASLMGYKVVSICNKTNDQKAQ